MSPRSARDDDAGESASADGRRAPGSGSHRVSKPTSAAREQASVQAYLDKYSEAITAGDTRTLTKLWGVPAFVVGAMEARVVHSEDEVEQFFAGAKDRYNARGIVGTRAEITHLDWISDDLVIATVRWPYLDRDDRVLGEETSSYTLLRGEDGSFKVRVATLRGESAGEAAR